MSDNMTVANDHSGLDSDRIADLRGRIQHAIDKGPLPSIQIALARNGELVLFETFGAEDNDTRYNVFSCTKPLVASAIWKASRSSMSASGSLGRGQAASAHLP